MRIILPFIILLFASICSYAGRIVGTVTDSSGGILSYSTIEIVGKNISTTANSEGRYFLNLAPGTYLLICQHVGYRKQEKLVEVGEGTVTVNFQLARQELTLEEVIVQKGEDPAYEIIRNAIKKRTQHRDELKKFTVEV
ncbi:MAG TPA: carboxypeptidase-like regulatory domain-containing protein, partial [Chitinophagaceae bacterium]